MFLRKVILFLGFSFLFSSPEVFSARVIAPSSDKWLWAVHQQLISCTAVRNFLRIYIPGNDILLRRAERNTHVDLTFDPSGALVFLIDLKFNKKRSVSIKDLLFVFIRIRYMPQYHQLHKYSDHLSDERKQEELRRLDNRLFQDFSELSMACVREKTWKRAFGMPLIQFSYDLIPRQYACNRRNCRPKSSQYADFDQPSIMPSLH